MKDKDIRISYNVHAMIKAKIVELSVRTGKTVTIKNYIDALVLKDLSKNLTKKEDLSKDKEGI